MRRTDFEFELGFDIKSGIHGRTDPIGSSTEKFIWSFACYTLEEPIRRSEEPKIDLELCWLACIQTNRPARKNVGRREKQNRLAETPSERVNQPLPAVSALTMADPNVVVGFGPLCSVHSNSRIRTPRYLGGLAVFRVRALKNSFFALSAVRERLPLAAYTNFELTGSCSV